MNLEPFVAEQPPRRRRLDGGAVLLSVPVPAAHSVSCGFWLRRGSEAEPPGWEGVTHFLEHAVFKGTDGLDASGLARAFDRLGASVDAYTTKDHVAFTLRVLPEYFREASRLLLEMVLRPALEPAALAREREVVCAEIQEALDTPEDRLHDVFVAALYGDHPRARPILGTVARVRALDRDAVAAAHRELFAPARQVVVVAAAEPVSLQEVLADDLADLQPAAGPGLPPGTPLTPGEMLAGARRDGRTLVLPADLQQVYFELGGRAVPFHHPDRIPLAVLTHLLGGGMSSRIFQTVREREGLAYSVYTYTDLGRDTGLVSCAGSCDPVNLERVIGLIAAEYRRLLREGVDADELETNRAQLKSQLIFSLEGVSNQMARAARDEILFGACQTVRELVARVDAVTTDDLVRCARSYFDPDRLLLAVHGPRDDVPDPAG